MVGTRGKGSKSKSKGLAFVPNKPRPLKIVNAEAADGPSGEEEKNEEAMFGGMHEQEQVMNEVNDEQEIIAFEIDDLIVDGNKAVLTNLGGEDNLESVCDAVDAVNNMDVENSIKLTPVEGPEADKDVHTQEKEKEPDVNACVTNDTKDLSASEHVLGEILTENMDSNKEANELLAEVPVSTPAENVDKTIKENAGPKKKIVKKKIIKRKILPRQAVTVVKEKLQPSDGNEEEEKEPGVNACVSNDSEDLAASEHVLVEILTKNMDTDKEANELTVKENASPANEVKALAENVIRPKKKIIKKKLVKRKVLLAKSVTAGNEAKLQPSGGNEGSDVLCKAGISHEVNPLFLEDNEATGEASKLDDTENAKNEEKVKGQPVVKVSKKQNSIGKKKAQGQSSVQAGNAQQKPKLTNDESASKDGQTIEHDIKNEQLVKPKAKPGLLKKRKNKKVIEEGTQNVNTNDTDQPESSKNGELSKKVDSMGMIFMCSSDTKKDCYKYNVFGLPAAKKDLVSKIYQGMRLFLFDVNLKMLYGIYKAAEPGSYNIEPNAFRSQFPAQVRFTILDDCLPLAEEKFKKLIKENYFTKNKFDCQLTNEQVKNLCKLFRETTKKSKSKSKLGGQSQRVAASTRLDRKRKQPEDSQRVGPGPISSRDRERRRKSPVLLRHAPVIRGREEIRRAPVVMGQNEMGRGLVVRGEEATRLAPVVIDDRYRHPVVVYDREAYRPAVVSSSLYQPLRAEDPARTRIYSYERDPGVDTYRRDPAIDYRNLEISAPRELTEVRRRDPAIDYRNLEISAPRESTEVRRRDPAIDYRNLEISAPRESTEVRRRDPAIHYTERSLRDPYVTYREPPTVYREPASAYATNTREPPTVYREPASAYATDSRREHYDYLSTGVRYPEYYRSDDHRPPLPLHRRY